MATKDGGKINGPYKNICSLWWKYLSHSSITMMGKGIKKRFESFEQDYDVKRINGTLTIRFKLPLATRKNFLKEQQLKNLDSWRKSVVMRCRRRYETWWNLYSWLRTSKWTFFVINIIKTRLKLCWPNRGRGLYVYVDNIRRLNMSIIYKIIHFCVLSMEYMTDQNVMELFLI